MVMYGRVVMVYGGRMMMHRGMMMMCDSLLMDGISLGLSHGRRPVHAMSGVLQATCSLSVASSTRLTQFASRLKARSSLFNA